MSKLVIVFSRFNTEHLVKDVFLFPLYLSKELNLQLEVVYDNDNDLPFPFFENVTFLNLKSGGGFNSFKSILAQLSYIKQEGRNISFVFLFHVRWYSFLIGSAYKRRQKEGYVYIKGDLSVDEAKDFFDYYNIKK